MAAGGKCPKCGKGLCQRKGSKGDFLGCSGYPDCTYTRDLAAPAPAKAARVPQVGAIAGTHDVDPAGASVPGETDSDPPEAPAETGNTPTPDPNAPQNEDVEATGGAGPWADDGPAETPAPPDTPAEPGDDFEQRTDEELVKMVGAALKRKCKGKTDALTATSAYAWMEKNFKVQGLKDLGRENLLRAIRNLELGQSM